MRQTAHLAHLVGGSLICLLLLGCGSLLGLGGKQRNVALYNLTAIDEARADLPSVDWQLIVEEPFAAGGLESNRIPVRTSPNRLEYFAGARWAVRLPKMLQTVVIESLESSGRIDAVGREAIGMRSDFNLRIEIRRLQAEVWENRRKPTVRVGLTGKILRQPRQEIIASRNFETSLEAASGALPDVVAAFDTALHEILRELVAWTLTEPQTSAAAGATPADTDRR